LINADEAVDRRELVWIKRFLLEHDRPQLYERLLALIDAGTLDEKIDPAAAAAAAERMSNADKRRLVYNLAQMCKSTGHISAAEYTQILACSEAIGVPDTDADRIIHSVFSINDTFMAILGVLAIGVILYTTKVVIVPLVIALFIAMIVGRVESALARALSIRRRRWLTKVAASVLIIGGLFALVMAAAVAGKDVMQRRDYYGEKISTALHSVQALAASHGITLLDRTGAIEQLKRLPLGSAVSKLAGSLLSLFGTFMLVAIITGFLVFARSDYTGILQEMNEKISAYVSIKTLSSLLTGLAVLALCKAFGVDFALFWAILGFLLNFIPSVGSIIASVPPILLAMIQLASWSTIVVFAVVFVVVQVLIGQVIEPKLMGDRLAIKPLAILLGLIFWGFLWGLPGMFLAAPLMALLRILSSYFNFSRGLERLLAAD
jgi:AI-2 transport protein TqsA